jgi:predicted nucleic acid-binding protein
VTRYVLDANVVIALVARDQERVIQVEEFWAEVTTRDQLLGPRMLIPECASALRTKVYDKLINEDQALRWMASVLRMPVTVVEDERQFFRAIELAGASRRRKAYDMQYLATAEITGGILVTSDNGLRQRAIEVKHPVRFLR